MIKKRKKKKEDRDVSQITPISMKVHQANLQSSMDK
jgi:hypothetical protein